MKFGQYLLKLFCKNKYFLIFFILTVIFISGNSSNWTNTTQFWKIKLNTSQMHFTAYAGYEEIDWYYTKNTTGMYYQLYSAMGHDIKQASPNIPLIIWLQGGGASSQFGAHRELGPIRIDKGQAKLFHASWNIFGHTLFIDQPLNVGFSYKAGDRKGKDQVSSSHQGADHLLNFLDNFYKTWPTLKQSPVYLTGQSFAGHYIPAFARKIIINQTWRAQVGMKLQGIAIGNGWTDPSNQVNFFDSYLWSVGVISTKFRDVCTWFQTNAMLNIYEGNYRKATSFSDFIFEDTFSQKYLGNISIFNFKDYSEQDDSFSDFLQNNSANLNGKSQYIFDNDAVYHAYADDATRSYAQEMVFLLRNVKVLLYNGQLDMVCNTPGVLLYLNSLNWQGISQWKRTKKSIWTIHGQNAGWAKTSGNLWFALVNQAGHMVPQDQPQRAFNLLGHFINNQRNWKQ